MDPVKDILLMPHINVDINNETVTFQSRELRALCSSLPPGRKNVSIALWYVRNSISTSMWLLEEQSKWRVDLKRADEVILLPCYSVDVYNM